MRYSKVIILFTILNTLFAYSQPENKVINTGHEIVNFELIDSTLIVYSIKSGQVFLWNLEKKEFIKEWDLNTQSFDYGKLFEETTVFSTNPMIRFSDNDSLLGIALYEANSFSTQNIQVFDVQRDSVVFKILGVKNLLEFGISPNGRVLYYIREVDNYSNVATFIDIETNKVLSELEDVMIGTVSFSSNGALFTAGSIHIQNIYCGKDGRIIATLTSPYRNRVTCFGPDNLLMFTTLYKIRIWDFGTNEIVRSYNTDNEIPTLIKYYPHEKYVASATRSGKIIFYNTDNFFDEKRFSLIEKHSSPVANVKFSPDGSKYVTFNEDEFIIRISGKGEVISGIAKFTETIIDPENELYNIIDAEKIIMDAEILNDSIIALSLTTYLPNKIELVLFNYLHNTCMIADEHNQDGLNFIELVFSLNRKGNILFSAEKSFSESKNHILKIDNVVYDNILKDLSIGKAIVTPNGEYTIAIKGGYNSDEIYIWDNTKNKLMKQLQYSFLSDNIFISHNSKNLFLVNDITKTIIVIDIEKGNEIKSISFPDMQELVSFSISGYDNYFAILYEKEGDNNYDLVLYDWKEEKIISRKRKLYPSIISLADNSDLYEARIDDTLVVIEKNEFDLVAESRQINTEPVIQIGNLDLLGIQKLFYSNDGKLLLVWAADNVVNLIDAGSGRIIRRYNGQSDLYGFNFDGSLFATSEYPGSVLNIYNTETGSVIKKIDKGQYAVFFNGSNKIVYTSGGFFEDSYVNVYDIDESKNILKWNLSKEYFFHFALTPDDKNIHLIPVNGNIHMLLNIESGTDNKKVILEKDIYDVKYSYDEQFIAYAISNQVHVLNKNYEEIATISGYNDFAFNPVKNEIALGELQRLAIYDIDSLKLVRVFNSHLYDYKDTITFFDNLSGFSYSMDGKYISCADFNNIIDLDLIGGHHKNVFMSDIKHVKDLFFSQNGYEIISGRESGEVNIIDLKSGKSRIINSLKGLNLMAIDYLDNKSLVAVRLFDKNYSYFLKVIDTDNNVEVANLKTDWWVGSEYLTFLDNENLIVKTNKDSISTFNTKTNRFADRQAINGNFLIDANKNQLISIEDDNIIKISDLKTGKSIRKIKTKHKGNIYNEFFIVNDTLIAISPGSYRPYFSVWDIKNDNQVFPKIADGNIEDHTKYEDQFKCIASCDSIIFGAGDYKSVRMWNYHTGKFIRSFKGHSDVITTIEYSPDNNMLISGSDDGTIKLWNVESGEEIVTIINSEGNEQVIITPDNYYFCTKGAYHKIVFRKGIQIFEFDQFDMIFNRPDIVLDRIGLANKETIELYYKAYLKRLKKLGFNPEQFNSDFHTPKLDISGSVKIDDLITINITAKDSLYKLKKVNVWVNNVAVYGESGIDVSNENEFDIKKELKLKLSEGQNKIELSVMNAQAVESARKTIFEDYKSDTPVLPNLYLIAISASSYQQSDFNLKYSVKDGRDLVKLYSESDSDTFENIYVDTLFNKNVTLENVKALKQKLLKTNVDDQVVLYVSGHGLLDENLDFYFASHDMDFDDPAKYGISYDILEDLLDSIPARKKLFMMDACHSGEVDKDELKVVSDTTVMLADGKKSGLKSYSYRGAKTKTSRGDSEKLGLQNSFELMQELFTDLSRGSGAQVISAAAGDSYALESPEWNNGVFTYAILNGLKNNAADKNQNGEVTVSELRSYVVDEVQRLTDGRQKPTSRQENVEFDFRVW